MPSSSAFHFGDVAICVRNLFILLGFYVTFFKKNSERKVVQLSLMTIHGYPFILGGKKVRVHCRKINMKTDV